MGEPVAGSSKIVFVDDDDDQIVDDEWAETDSQAEDAAQQYAGSIRMQMRMCAILLCVIPILLLMIAMQWRRYGEAIRRRQAEEEANTHKEKDT